MRLKGKVAIVTGASKGIGKVIAQVYSKEGAKVILTARSERELEEVCGAISADGGEADFAVVDIRRKGQVKEMVAHTLKRYGRIDILVNNAGLPMYGFAIDDPSSEAEERYEDILNTNYGGYWYAARYAVPYMKQQKSGCILNISSVRGINALANETAYCSAKGAINMFTRSLAIEMAPHNVRVNTISPGAIQVDIIGHWVLNRYGEAIHEEYLKKFKDVHMLGMRLNQPMEKIGQPEDVAYAAVYLASEEAGFVTGANLVVDGGLTCVLAEPPALNLEELSAYCAKSKEMREWLKSLQK